MKNTPNYNLVRKDRGRDIKGGGVAFLVHESVPFQLVDSPATLVADPHIEELTIKINSNNNNPLFIRNLYIPPASSCDTPNYSPVISNLADGIDGNYMLLGDFNAHDLLWHTKDTPDNRGAQIAEWIGECDLGVLKDDVSTSALHRTYHWHRQAFFPPAAGLLITP